MFPLRACRLAMIFVPLARMRNLAKAPAECLCRCSRASFLSRDNLCRQSSVERIRILSRHALVSGRWGASTLQTLSRNPVPAAVTLSSVWTRFWSQLVIQHRSVLLLLDLLMWTGQGNGLLASFKAHRHFRSSIASKSRIESFPPHHSSPCPSN